MKNNNNSSLSDYPEHLKEKILKRIKQKEYHIPERNRYVNAIQHFILFKKNRSHFMSLIFNFKKDDVADMIHLANKNLDKNLEFNDPATYKLLSEVIPAFKQTNYHKINYLGMMEEIAKINHKKKSKFNLKN